MSFVTRGLGVLIDALANPDSAGPRGATIEDVQLLGIEIASALGVIKDTMDSADSKSQEAVTVATDTAGQLERIGFNIKDITEHTYTVMVPHSLSWLAGFIVTKWIDPLRHDVAELQHQVKFLLGWRGQINTWRKDWVDPNINQWRAWHTWFDTWPRSVLFRWHDYFEHPAHFASWAAPTLVNPIVSLLAGRRFKVARDALALMLVESWSDEPDRVWHDVQVWLLTDGK